MLRLKITRFSDCLWNADQWCANPNPDLDLNPDSSLFKLDLDSDLDSDSKNLNPDLDSRKMTVDLNPDSNPDSDFKVPVEFKLLDAYHNPTKLIFHCSLICVVMDARLCVKMLCVTNPDIFCIPCKPRVCKFPKKKRNSMDMYHVIHTIFRKFTNPRLTSPSGPIRYSILKKSLFWKKKRSLYLNSHLKVSEYVERILKLNHTKHKEGFSV